NSFIRETLSLLNKTIDLQAHLNDSMRKTKAFIRWLHKCIAMVASANDPNASISGGDSQSESGSYVLTNQDLNLIMNFLRENSLTDGIKFENIAFFCCKTKYEQARTSGGASTSGSTPGSGPSTSNKSRKKGRGRTAASSRCALILTLSLTYSTSLL